jgi:hypothetical protein
LHRGKAGESGWAGEGGLDIHSVEGAIVDELDLELDRLSPVRPFRLPGSETRRRYCDFAPRWTQPGR